MDVACDAVGQHEDEEERVEEGQHRVESTDQPPAQCHHQIGGVVYLPSIPEEV